MANDYDALQIGSFMSKSLTPVEAREFLIEGRGTRYDPKVVDVFIEMLGGVGVSVEANSEIHVPSSKLQSGMVLARDLVSAEGLLLLSKEYVLDGSLIEQIRSFERTENRPLEIYVRAGKG